MQSTKEKTIRRVLALLTLVILGYGIYYVRESVSILSGYGAKVMCSCVYLSDRSPNHVLDHELAGFPYSLASYRVQQDKNSATGSLFGLGKRRAIYREGIGCTLVPAGEDSTAIQPVPVVSRPERAVNPDTVPWPYGDRISTYFPSSVNRTKLEKTVNEVFTSNDKNTRALLVVYKNELIAEQYAEPFTRNTRQAGWSMSKSVTNALVGHLIKNGKLRIEQQAPVEGWNRQNDLRSEITINHLLQMQSGLEWWEFYSAPSEVTRMLFTEASAYQVAATARAEDVPGTAWYYASGSTNILSGIMRKTVGDSVYHRLPYNVLFHPLGMYSARMEPDAAGNYVGSSYIMATARDWARFGLLFLNEGEWNGKQLLPESWVEYSRTPAAHAPRGTYGAHFWLNAGEKNNPENRALPDVPRDAYSANGFEEQRIFIIPSAELVVVRLGQTKGNFDFNSLLADIIDCLPR
jgi:CubicO group peptidase (beta-lactamase class C family)